MNIKQKHLRKKYDFIGNVKADYHQVARQLRWQDSRWFQGQSESGNRALGNRSILSLVIKYKRYY